LTSADLERVVERPLASSVDPAPNPSTTEPALAATNLTKRYRRGAVALADVTLTIPAGSITALVGPNGAGKSTLIRTWMGFEKPTSGSVRTMGADPFRERRQALRHAAYLAQTPSLYAELTVQDHLDLAAHFRGADFDRDLAVERLNRFGIGFGRKAGQLSGGGAAQLGLAIAIALRARVLLLDEPLSHLDPLARREFIDSIVEHRRASGATVVLSSHIVSDLARACDRLVVLVGGRVRLSDSIDAIVGRTRSGDAVQAAALEDLVVGLLVQGNPSR
jgi:ABC-2 type transport system ATP-binding protein